MSRHSMALRKSRALNIVVDLLIIVLGVAAIGASLYTVYYIATNKLVALAMWYMGTVFLVVIGTFFKTAKSAVKDLRAKLKNEVASDTDEKQ